MHRAGIIGLCDKLTIRTARWFAIILVRAAADHSKTVQHRSQITMSTPGQRCSHMQRAALLSFFWSRLPSFVFWLVSLFIVVHSFLLPHLLSFLCLVHVFLSVLSFFFATLRGQLGATNELSIWSQTNTLVEGFVNEFQINNKHTFFSNIAKKYSSPNKNQSLNDDDFTNIQATSTMLWSPYNMICDHFWHFRAIQTFTYKYDFRKII